MTMVVTGWGPSGWDLYGKNFAETFHHHWPTNVDLVAYVEEMVDLPRGQCRSLWDCDGANEFYARHKNVPEHCGRAPVHGWKDKNRDLGYAFRWDAVKWFRQILIPHHAAQSLQNGDILAWFDADVITFADVPTGFIDGLVGAFDLVNIGRDRGDSELGFWAVRINETSRAFLRSIADCYTKDEVFGLKQWHSGHVFDHHLAKYAAAGMKIKSLAPPMDGHVWFHTPLGRYTDHLKGDKRKKAGSSRERHISA